MSGLPLFEWPGGRRPARVRRDNPSGSHQAADHAEASGLISRHAATVLQWLYRHPGLTAKELERLEGFPLTRVEVGRRTSELERGGWITREDPDPGELRLWPTLRGVAWAYLEARS